jgi:hypothetical protein
MSWRQTEQLALLVSRTKPQSVGRRLAWLPDHLNRLGSVPASSNGPSMQPPSPDPTSQPGRWPALTALDPVERPDSSRSLSMSDSGPPGMTTSLCDCTRSQGPAIPKTFFRLPRSDAQGDRRGDLPAWVQAVTTDRCGMVQIANVASGLRFVGAVAAALAVAEILRALASGPPSAMVSRSSPVGRGRPCR